MAQLALLPDGIRTIFPLDTIVREVHQVLKYNKNTNSYENLSYKFDEYTNEITFDNAPEEGCILMISSTKPGDYCY